MALQRSGLSESALALRHVLGQEIAGLDENRIIIGSPKQAEEQLTGADQQLNLFFYRVEMDSVRPDLDPREAPTARAFFLATPFGVADTENNVSAGENELRLIGEVVRVLHEKPVMKLLLDGEEYAHLQITSSPLDVDAMNKVWAAQGETVFRISVGYEMALIPITLEPEELSYPKVTEIRQKHYSKPSDETNPQNVVDGQTPEEIVTKAPEE